MKTEHWYSPTLKCWLIADSKSGDLILCKHKKWALTFNTEKALLKRFPLSSKTELMG